MVDFMEGIEQDARDMARLAHSFEVIADTLVKWYLLEQKRFELEHPAKPEHARDATVTRIPNELDRLRESQGATGESDEDWQSLGPRERAFLDRTKDAAPGRKTGPEPETSGSESD